MKTPSFPADAADPASEAVNAPSMVPSLRFLTLEGFEMPKLEENQEFDRLGTAYRVHWHVGAGAVDFRGVYKNSGS